jgi:squalene-hopene/tetraprenyl-beta-curcumene cyclase
LIKRDGKWADRKVALALVLAACAIALSLVACSSGKPPASDSSWDPKAAAAYLDRRMQWWIGWKGSAADHSTFCVSCHTAVPYALARPTLRATLAEAAPTATERRLIEDVRRRVRLWSETNPYYSDDYKFGGPGKSAESRGTEAVLNALILAENDARSGQLSPDTITAFEHMWAEQHVSGASAGAWAWLDFDESPWEATDSQYYGAALAAMAVAVAPENYQSRQPIQDDLGRLRGYLARQYAVEPLHHRLIVLWASTKMPALLDAGQRQSLIDEALRAQNSDGGWSLSALMNHASKRNNPLLIDRDSDGYATGLVTLLLSQSAMPGAAPEVQRGLTWLVRHQQGHGGSWIRGPEGFWVARSLNTWRNPWSNVGRFMSDAATAYAVLALTEAPSTAERRVASVQAGAAVSAAHQPH